MRRARPLVLLKDSRDPYRSSKIAWTLRSRAMDLMSKAIDEMRLRHSTYQCEAFKGPWSMDYQSGACGIHIVLDGRALLRAGAASFRLAAGDLVLLPLSSAHTMKSVERAPRGESSRMLSGLCDFDAPDHPLFSVLPPIIHATPVQLQDNPRYGTYLENSRKRC